MTVVYVLFLTVLGAAVVLLAAVRPVRSSLSGFELKRRVAEGDSAALKDSRRSKAYVDITSLQRASTALLLVTFALIATVVLGALIGTIASISLAVFYGSLSRLKPVRRFADALYHERETGLLGLSERYHDYLWWIRWSSFERHHTEVHSREELAHLIATSRALSDEKQRRLPHNALAFHERQVESAMTPRSKLKTVKRTEILGPLVLDELHKSGHQSFPVVNGDANHVVGLLRLSEVQILDTTRKHTALAETAMHTSLHYVSKDAPIEEALEQLLGNQEHVLLVVDDDSQVVGLITLSDIMRSLFSAA